MNPITQILLDIEQNGLTSINREKINQLGYGEQQLILEGSFDGYTKGDFLREELTTDLGYHHSNKWL